MVVSLRTDEPVHVDSVARLGSWDGAASYAPFFLLDGETLHTATDVYVFPLGVTPSPLQSGSRREETIPIPPNALFMRLYFTSFRLHFIQQGEISPARVEINVPVASIAAQDIQRLKQKRYDVLLQTRDFKMFRFLCSKGIVGT